MNSNDSHYRKILHDQRATRFASCGYSDRFDPFILNKAPVVRAMYESIFESSLPQPPVDRMLDIGCGTGIYFDALAPYAREIDALDCAESMIETARQYCQSEGLNSIRAAVGSAQATGFEANSFDVVVELDVLHHVEDLQAVLREVHRVLKPGGLFFVFEPNIRNPLMFLAQALPAEERLALRRNWPGTLRRLLEEHFETQRWDGVCALITQTTGWRRRIFDFYLAFWKATGLKKWYPRQVWLGQKR